MEMQELVNTLKKSGYIIQSFKSYGGMSNTYDYGPLGSLLKNKLKEFLIQEYVLKEENSYLVETSILTKDDVLKTSGHLQKFSDFFIDCKNCKRRFKLEENEVIKNCPYCDSKDLTEKRSFNLLFETSIGVVNDSKSRAFLRPETAQGIFANFDTLSGIVKKKLPFSICQSGKSFRNEITPSNFIYRTLEFEQFEIETFIDPKNWKKVFETAVSKIELLLGKFGVSKEFLDMHEQSSGERAHYSKRTIDVMFKFPFGRNELLGIAYRTDFDLKKHQEATKARMTVLSNDNKPILPHVVETSIGLDRLILAIFVSSLKNETLKGGESRLIMKVPYKLAPITAAILPLSSKLRDKSGNVFKTVIESLSERNLKIQLDTTSTSIGKKYRRYDEIGVPFCVTIDFETLEDNKVTIRDRNSMAQKRVLIENIANYIMENISS